MTQVADRFPSIRAALPLLLMLAGCAGGPAHPTLIPGPVAIAPAGYAPEADFNVYAQGKGAAAGKLGAEGAATGAGTGAVAPLSMGPIGVVAYPIIAPFTILIGAVVGGTMGASYGALHGLNANETSQVRAMMDRAVSQIGVNENIGRRVRDLSRAGGIEAELVDHAGPRTRKDLPLYGDLHPIYRAVVEISAEKVGMAAHKGDPPRVALQMRLHVRVVCLRNSCADRSLDLDWAGKPRRLAEWSAGGAGLLAAEFDRGYDALAHYVWETLWARPDSAGPFQPH